MSDMDDIDRLFDESPDIPAEGEIISVDRKVAADVFGENAKDPQREVLEVTVDDGEGTWSETFNIPDDARAASHPRQRLNRYRETYGSLPEVGQVVHLERGKDGFPVIALEVL